MTQHVVEHAIVGIVGGRIRLSLYDVEQVLVLANSIRVSHAHSELMHQSHTVTSGLHHNSISRYLVPDHALNICRYSAWRQHVCSSYAVELT